MRARRRAHRGGRYRCGQVWGIHVAVGGGGSTTRARRTARRRDRHRGVDVFLCGISGRGSRRVTSIGRCGRSLTESRRADHYDDFFARSTPDGVLVQRQPRRVRRRGVAGLARLRIRSLDPLQTIRAPSRTRRRPAEYAGSTAKVKLAIRPQRRRAFRTHMELTKKGKRGWSPARSAPSIRRDVGWGDPTFGRRSQRMPGRSSGRGDAPDPRCVLDSGGVTALVGRSQRTSLASPDRGDGRECRRSFACSRRNDVRAAGVAMRR